MKKIFLHVLILSSAVTNLWADNYNFQWLTTSTSISYGWTGTVNGYSTGYTLCSYSYSAGTWTRHSVLANNGTTCYSWYATNYITEYISPWDGDFSTFGSGHPTAADATATDLSSDDYLLYYLNAFWLK
jgi:hypothetical protein